MTFSCVPTWCVISLLFVIRCQRRGVLARDARGVIGWIYGGVTCTAIPTLNNLHNPQSIQRRRRFRCHSSSPCKKHCAVPNIATRIYHTSGPTDLNRTQSSATPNELHWIRALIACALDLGWDRFVEAELCYIRAFSLFSLSMELETFSCLVDDGWQYWV